MMALFSHPLHDQKTNNMVNKHTQGSLPGPGPCKQLNLIKTSSRV